jgi:hypothetical protein
MNLVTIEIAKRLPGHCATEDVPDDRKLAVAKFFHPMGRGTWYAVEASVRFEGDDVEYAPRDVLDRLDDAEDVVFFGYVVSPLGPDCDEWGYFSLRELERVRVRGLGIERDIHWRPQTIPELKPARCPTCSEPYPVDRPATFTKVLGWECSPCRLWRQEHHTNPAHRLGRAP